MHELPPPIPFPGPSPKRVAEKSGEMVFRLPWWALFVCYCILAAIDLALFGPTLSRRDSDSAQVVIVISLIALGLYIWFYREFFKVVVSESEIKAHTLWSIPTSFDWQDIEIVRPINLGGFRSLRLYSTQSKRVIWLPLYLSDRKGFKSAVMQFAPPDNPLRRYLEEHTK